MIRNNIQILVFIMQDSDFLGGQIAIPGLAIGLPHKNKHKISNGLFMKG